MYQVKSKTYRIVTLVALLATLTLSPGSTRLAFADSFDSAPRLSSAVKRQLTAITGTETATGFTVTIQAARDLTGAVSYRSGSRFVVVIPEADASGLQVGLGPLKDFNIESHQDDVMLSFKIESATEVHFKQAQNQITVTVSRPAAAPAALTIPALQVLPAPISTRTENAARAGTAPTLLVPPQPAGSGIDSILGQLAGFIGGAPKIEQSTLDLSVPESPAFTVLGLTPQTVVRPTSPRGFATSLLSGLDKRGNFQSGLAVDTAPYLLFNGQDLTLSEYNQNQALRLLTRTQFSLAVAKGSAADDPTTKLSLGLNLTLYDNGDPRIYHPERYNSKTKSGDVLSCFKDSLLTPSEFNQGPFPPLRDDATPEQRTAYEQRKKNLLDALDVRNNAAADKCRELARKANWNKSSWTIAFAPSWISKTGATSNFKWNGAAFWTSYAYGFEGVSGLKDIGQLILHARYRNKEQVPDPAKSGSFMTQDSALFGSRFRVGNPDFGLNAEASFIHNRPKNQATKNTYEFSFAAEAKLTSNVYFVISGGSRGPEADNAKSRGFFMTSFKYGFSKKPQIATPPSN